MFVKQVRKYLKEIKARYIKKLIEIDNEEELKSSYIGKITFQCQRMCSLLKTLKDAAK